MEAVFQQLPDAKPVVAFLHSFFGIVTPLLEESDEEDTSSVQIMLIASSLLDFFLLDPQSLVRLAAHLEMYKSEDAPDVTFIMPFVNLAVPLVSDTSSLLEFYVTFLTARFSEESSLRLILYG